MLPSRKYTEREKMHVFGTVRDRVCVSEQDYEKGCWWISTEFAKSVDCGVGKFEIVFLGNGTIL